MKEIYYFTSGLNYELYLQVTETTHCHDVITIIKNAEIWKEDKAEYNTNQYTALDFANKYQQISELKFESAQNQILQNINHTRESLKALYYKLWTEYLIEKIRIEELLAKSIIDKSDFYAVSNFRIEAARSTELGLKRSNLYETFNRNYQQSVFSNEDIFGKVANERLDVYLNRRKELLNDQ
jgi:hypothetical protein